MDRIKRHRFKILITASALLIAIAAWSLFLWGDEISGAVGAASEWLRGEVGMLNSMPLALYPLAILLLPIFALPVSPVYLLAGGREESMWLVIPVCYAGLVANMAVSYFIARKFSSLIRPALERRGLRAPSVPKDEECDIIFLVRMIPGNPLTVQNYLLGLAGVGFFRYMVVSMPVQLVQMSGYIYFSDGILRGDAANFMLGVSLLCVVAVVARIVQKRMKKRDGLSKIKR